ncbi:hypothetical protein POM88_049514 [Heracleum sosnowskyi]|uniref:Replication protein n=1 Tax=Heracleum sosnowskyi TaxID=360622 RepID=A0AAD8GX59_9APIA|nr:hypothetical protein POM88_049514 [Heracleum sosnowskyi]
MKLNECEDLNIPLHPLTPAEPVPPSDKLDICEEQKMKTKFIPRKLVEKDTPALQKENCNLNIEVPHQFQKSTLPTNKCETTSHKRKLSISAFGTKITGSRNSVLHPVLNVDKIDHVKRNKTFASPCTPSVDESTTYPVTKSIVKTKTILCTPRQQLPPLKSLEQQPPRNKGKEPMYQSSQESRFKMTSRSLNYDDDASECNTRTYNNDIEYSLIRDFGSDESDFSSEEDEGDDLNYDFSEMDTESGNVVSEYATLGAPNVQYSKCFAWMWKEEWNQKIVLDVIGILHSKEIAMGTNNKNGKNHVNVKFKLYHGRKKINVTFWGFLAEQFHTEITNELEEPVILIIASGKLTTWQDEIDICNYSPTKFYLNYEHHSVSQLRKKLKDPVFWPDNCESQRKLVQLCTLDELKKLGTDFIQEEVICKAILKAVKNTNDWNVSVCTSCYTTTENKDDNYWCPNCKRIFPSPLKRFNISAIISDDTGKWRSN